MREPTWGYSTLCQIPGYPSWLWSKRRTGLLDIRRGVANSVDGLLGLLSVRPHHKTDV